MSGRWQPGKPRVIRNVVKRDAKGRPKMAADRRLDARLERVTARSPRPCASKQCQRSADGLIRGGEEYAKVHANEGRGRFVAGRMVYSPIDYHYECVPEKYRPLIRFVQQPAPMQVCALCPPDIDEHPFADHLLPPGRRRPRISR